MTDPKALIERLPGIAELLRRTGNGDMADWCIAAAQALRDLAAENERLLLESSGRGQALMATAEAVATNLKRALAAEAENARLRALGEGLGKAWKTLVYVEAASECEASRAAARETMAEISPSLTAWEKKDEV